MPQPVKSGSASRSSSEDTRLLKALAHPLRMKLLSRLNERVASPVELARELNEPLGNVSYHVRILDELDCIELVRTTPRRGAVEHHYRATQRALITDEVWARLPSNVRKAISGTALEGLVDHASRALQAGTFDRRDDRHLSYTHLVLDEKGWRDVNKALETALDRVMRIQAQAADRLQRGAEEVRSTVAMLHYESPPPRQQDRPARAPRRRVGNGKRGGS